MTTTIQDLLLAKGVDVPPFMHPDRTVLMDTCMDILLRVEHHCPACGDKTLVYDLCSECEAELIDHDQDEPLANCTDDLPY